MGMMINRRRAYGGKNLPYDAEIEYLQSSGYESIYTGVEMQQDVTHRFEMGLYIVSDTGTSRYIISAKNLDTNVNAIQVYTNSGRMYTQTAFLQVSLGVTSEMVATVLGKNNSVSYQGKIINAVYAGVSGKEKIYLLYNPEISNLYGALVRISYCKIYKDTTLVRDYIPVRKGTTGYMYDKVSGQLFGNTGTGSFILGPDV